MKIIPPRVLFFAGLIFSLPVFSKQIIVCASGCDFSSVQQAVQAARAGDTILINVKGALTENRIIISKNLVIRGLGQTVTILQAHEQRGMSRHRIFQITGGALVSIENIHLVNGQETADNSSANGAGGAILVDGTATSVTLKQVMIKHCDVQSRGVQGAGISVLGQSCSLQVMDCVFDNNISNNGGGGAIYVAGYSTDVFVSNSIFKNNIAANGNGGAVVLEGNTSATFIGCGFSGNRALNRYNGGAVYTSTASAAFNNCTFTRNAADKEGGALRVEGGDIANCNFYYNTADNGGAISRGTGSAHQDLYVSNCTLLNNAATGYAPAGAGLHNASPTALIHLVNTVIDKSTSGTDLYSYAATSISTNEKNHVGKARFNTGSIRFASN